MTKPEIRERQGDRSLLDIALDIHMRTTGAMEGYGGSEHLNDAEILWDAINTWREHKPDSAATNFDNAVKTVLLMAVYEDAILCTPEMMNRSRHASA